MADPSEPKSVRWLGATLTHTFAALQPARDLSRSLSLRLGHFPERVRRSFSAARIARVCGRGDETHTRARPAERSSVCVRACARV